jgi:hypothetical protein
MISLERRLARLEKSRALSPVSQTPAPVLPQPAEVQVIAAQMAKNLHDEFESYIRLFHLGPEEALAKARAQCPGAAEEAARTSPEWVSWLDLRTLLQQDPGAALQKWQDVKEGAREEIRGGVLAAEAVAAVGGSPQGLAQFLALREELITAWQPRNGMEAMLIDQLAQLQCVRQSWFAELSNRRALSNAGSRRAPDEPVRLEDAQAIDQAMTWIARLQDMQMRVIGMLRGLRRGSSRVVIQRARQVNVGEQQINVTAGP